MPWAKLNDTLNNDAKLTALTDGAARLWKGGIVYCRKNLTDGFIPAHEVDLFPCRSNRKKALAELLAVLVAGKKPLWHAVPGGYQVNDYLDWNDSREEVLKAQANNRKRQADWQERKANFKKSTANTSSNASTNALDDASRNASPNVRTNNQQPKDQNQGQERASDDPARADAPFALSADKAEGQSGRRSAKASPTRELLEAFDQAHRARFSGQAAALNGGKDAKLMAEIWQQRGGDTDVVRQLIALFFASTDPYIARAGYTVGVFKSQIGKLVVEMVRRERPSASRGGILPAMSAPVQELCEAAGINQHTIFTWFGGAHFGATNGPDEMHLEIGPASDLDDADAVQGKVSFIQRHYADALIEAARRIYSRTLVIRGPIAPADRAVSA